MIVHIKTQQGIRLVKTTRRTKTEGSTRLVYTGLNGGLEHLNSLLKIETRLIDERFPSVMGECEIVTI